MSYYCCGKMPALMQCGVDAGSDAVLCHSVPALHASYLSIDHPRSVNDAAKSNAITRIAGTDCAEIALPCAGSEMGYVCCDRDESRRQYYAPAQDDFRKSVSALLTYLSSFLPT
eukprot:776175-Rhodomonas_salina.1